MRRALGVPPHETMLNSFGLAINSIIAKSHMDMERLKNQSGKLDASIVNEGMSSMQT